MKTTCIEPILDSQLSAASHSLVIKYDNLQTDIFSGHLRVGGSEGKESACNAETQVRSLSWEDPLEKAMGYPLQYSYLENFMDRGAWRVTVHGVTKSWTRLGN